MPTIREPVLLAALSLSFLLTATAVHAIDLEPPALVCPLVTSLCKVDGVIDPSEWSSASALTGLHLLGGDKLAERQATFWVMQDQQALYIAVRVPLPVGAKPVARETKHNGAVWDDDAVEVFVDPEASRQTYFQFIINSAGVTYDSRRPTGNWEGTWESRTSVANDRWELEMRLPFTSLGVATPKAGEVWGFNVCSDRKTPSPELSTWAPLLGGFHEPAQYGKLIFTGDSSRVRLESLGEVAAGRLKFGGGALNRDAGVVAKIQVDRDGAPVSRFNREATAGNALVLDWNCELPRQKDRPAPGNYRASFEVTSSNGLSIAHNAFSFRVYPPLVLTLRPYYLREKTLCVDVDAKTLNVPGDQLSLQMDLLPQGGESAVLSKSVQGLPADGTAAVEFGVADLAPGKYLLRTRATRRQDNMMIEEQTLPFEKPSTPPWFGSKEGLTDKVLAPWTPVKVKGTTVEPWGRKYVYDKRPFPSQVVTRNQSVLVAPIRVLATVDGKPYEVQSGRMKVVSQSPAVVTMSYQSSIGNLKLGGKVAVEYDGMVRHDLQLTSAEPVRLDSLVVEIPLKAENAKYLYHYPGSWNSAANARALPKEGFISGYKPFVWLGDEDRGLACFTESDQNWSVKDPSRSIEILRQGNQVLLRLNVVTAPMAIANPKSKIKNPTYSFFLQATPVKPVTEDVWDMRIIHAGYYGLEQQPYYGESSLTYPAKGNINLKQGSMEVWLRPFFDPHVKVDPAVSLGSYNRTLFMVRAGGATVDLYWNIEDRGLRFYVNEGSNYPILFTTHQDWKPGELHHVALTWGDAVSLYIDGQLVHRQPWRGLMERDLTEGQIIFGGNTCEFALDEIRLSDVPRTEFDLTKAPTDDEHTLLLDRLDDSFKPDGEKVTSSAKSGARKGGVVTEMAAFAPVKFGNGLLLYQEVKGSKKTYLDRMAELGVRTIVFHEHWTDLQNYTSTTHGKELHSLVKACHERGIKLLLYFGYLFADIAPEYPFYFDECMVYPRTGDYTRAPAQTDYSVCYQSPWQDFLADGIAKVMDEYNIDGVYLDGTEYPWPCQNLHHGCGYRKPDGTIGTSYSILAAREMVKRIYTIVKQRKPDGLVNVHNSTNMVIPTLSFATSTWDGEQFGGMASGPFALEVLPLDSFRCEFMGRQWGVPAEFLCYNRPYTYEQGLSFTLLHDVLIRGSAEEEGKLWRAMEEFGRKKSQFKPYWNNGDVVTTNHPDIKVSVWTRGAQGAMLVISNLGKERLDAGVTLNLKQLGLQPTARAVDALSKSPIALSHGQISIPLDSLNWRMVQVQ